MVALVDTGTTMLLAPEVITRELFRKIPTAFSDYTGLFSVPCNSGIYIPKFTITVNGERYVLDGSKYIVPQFQLVSESSESVTQRTNIPSEYVCPVLLSAHHQLTIIIACRKTPRQAIAILISKLARQIFP
jgi:hypothetical protein